MAKTTAVELSRTYTSFAGVDIRAVIEGQTLGTLQAISYAVQREKAPIYVMGRVDPLAFSRGKRGIAGTIISLLLDQHMIFHETFQNLRFIADNDEIHPMVADLNNGTPSGDSGLADLETGVAAFNANDIGSNYTLSRAWYVDQIPPFDVVIVAANEHGMAATMRIYGIEILNEGSGFSVDDIVIESQMTYVCRTILPWQRLGDWNMTGETTVFNSKGPSNS